MLNFDAMIAQLTCKYWIAVGAVVVVIATARAGRCAVSLIADPDIPAMPAVQTIDPEGFAVANRGVAADRELRQTFQNPSEFVVNEIDLSLALNGDDGGLVLDFYEVADVNADTWTPLGGPIQTILLPIETDLPASSFRLGLSLTEGSVFTLPARSDGTEGYGIEISNVDQVTNIGLMHHSNTGMDDFTGGKYYDESGTAPPSGQGLRDFGVWLVGAPIGGDYSDNGIIDAADYTVWRNNLGAPAGSLKNDTDGGVIGQAQYDTWKENFGRVVGRRGGLFSIQIDQATGEATLINNRADAQSIDYFELRSDLGDLNMAWEGVDGDTPIGMGWDRTGGSDASQLIELYLPEEGQEIAPLARLPLGTVLTGPAGDPENYSLVIGLASGAFIDATVEFIGSPGLGAASSLGTTVPEPASLAMQIIGMLTFLLPSFRSRGSCTL